MIKRQLTVSFFLNDRLAEVSTFGRLLFMGLCMLADKAGRLEDRPKRLKMNLLPYDDVDIDGLLAELAAAGLIVRYAAGGASYLAVDDWDYWQEPHNRERESVLPAPGAAQPEERQNTCQDVCQESCQADGIGTHAAALANEGQRQESCQEVCQNEKLCTGDKAGEAGVFEVMHRNAVQSRTNNNTPEVLKKIKEQKKEPTSSSEVVRYGPEHRRLAERLREKILANKADARVPADLSRWAETMRLIVERDKRTEARVEGVIDWAGQDPFWSGNILSADALRRHFDRLELAMQRGSKSQWGGSMFGADGNDPISRAAAKLEGMGL